MALIYPNQIFLNERPTPLWRHSLIILVGISGSGKSTFAARHFPATMCVSTDQCRAMISDSALNQGVSEDAFEIFYYIIEKRLKNGYPAVADSTALKPVYRQKLSNLAAKYGFNTVLILFNLPLEVCLQRDRKRRFSVGADVLNRQFRALYLALEQLQRERYNQVIVFEKPEQVEKFSFRWTSPLVELNDRGPFDIIGDIHGCWPKLSGLIACMGYSHDFSHPQGRKVVFLGDIMDRGSENLKVFDLVYDLWRRHAAYYVPGNHCNKLFRYINGKNVRVTSGLEATVREIEALSPQSRRGFASKFCQMYAQSPPYLVLDNGRLLVSHAGILRKFIGRVDDRVRKFCLYGPLTARGENKNPFAWTAEHCGEPLIVYGHLPVPEPRWENNTVNIDLGAAFGGSLAAFRYPEKEILQVK